MHPANEKIAHEARFERDFPLSTAEVLLEADHLQHSNLSRN